MKVRLISSAISCFRVNEEAREVEIPDEKWEQYQRVTKRLQRLHAAIDEIRAAQIRQANLRDVRAAAAHMPRFRVPYGYKRAVCNHCGKHWNIIATVNPASFICKARRKPDGSFTGCDSVGVRIVEEEGDQDVQQPPVEAGA
jgi:hypothetical protein